MKKVNLGCGTTVLEDWINIDGSFNAYISKFPLIRNFLFKIGLIPSDIYDITWPHNIIVRDVRKKFPFKDDSIDYIYSSHLIEHLTKDQANKMLEECFRVLKIGGLIRIATPDLEILTRKYIDDLENKISHCPSEKFLDILGVFQNKESSLLIKIFDHSQHKWIYDYNSIYILLDSIGFSKIEKKSYQEGQMPNIEFLDNRPDQSLYVEAVKDDSI